MYPEKDMLSVSYITIETGILSRLRFTKSKHFSSHNPF